MKLLYIVPYMSNSGGVARVLTEKINFFYRQFGYKIIVLVTDEKEQPSFYPVTRGVVIKYRSPHEKGSRFSAYRNFIKNEIRIESPSIILVLDNGLKGAFVPLWSGKIPTIYERHVTKKELLYFGRNTLERAKNRLAYIVIPLLIKRFSSLVVLNERMKKEWRHPSIKVIPNALNTLVQGEFVKKKKVVFVGRCCKQKGIDALLAIWSELHERFPDWELCIYGKSCESINSPVLNDQNIRVFSPVKNLDQIYGDASILFLTSKYEGFGMVLIEAMSYGVNCISFDCPVGPSEIISSGENGYLIKSKDTSSFVDRATELMTHKKLREQMGRQAQLDSRPYAPERIYFQWRAFFKSVVEHFVK